MVRLVCFLLLLLSLTLVAGCASAPPTGSAAAGNHAMVADVALAMIGVPYRYGGASPRGMDCSGLVYYAYHQAGMEVPRTVAELRRSSFSISPSHLRPGDLLFFRLNGLRVSHVGIYVGDGRFVHAPRTGKRVSIARLGNGYWKKRLAGTGRFY